jgi:aldehyde dehydrogenase (NAD+)
MKVSKQHFYDIADWVESQRHDLIQVLTSISSHEAADDEVTRAVKALRGVEQEWDYLEQAPHLFRLSIMQPTNVLLYSYVLYGLIPGVKFDEVFIKTSQKVSAPAKEIHEMFSSQFPANINLGYMTHEGFRKYLLPTSDVLVHTGSYNNALDLETELRNDQLFLFFGSGVNPFIVGPDADIDLAVRGSIDAHVFNSGQDCLCSNVFFVHESVLEHYLQTLKQKIADVSVGDRSDPSARVNPLFYDLGSDVLELFRQGDYQNLYGSEIDVNTGTIPPTVLLHPDISTAANVEFFCPVFYIVPYRQTEEIITYLEKPGNIEHAMGANVYGDPDVIGAIQDTHMVATNSTIFDIEDGNTPFGGSGVRANHVFYKGERIARPILISKELSLSSKD